MSVGKHALKEMRKEPVGVFEVVGTAVFLFALCLLFPYSGDDWTWGSHYAFDRLGAGFANYNGRYAGNLLIIALSRSLLLRSLVVALTLTAITFLISILADRDRRVYWGSLAVMAFIPVGVRTQSVVWASGFTNYVVPMLFLLVYLVFLQKSLTKGRGSRSNLVCVSMFLVGFVGALFMENITLSNIAVAVVVLIYTRVTRGYFDKMQCFFIAGSLVGAVLMFSNGAYLAILTHQDTYRSLGSNAAAGSNSSVSVVDKFNNVLVPGVALNNYAIAIALAFVSLIYFAKDVRKGKVAAANTILFLLFLMFSAYFLYSSFFAGAKVSSLHKLVNDLMAIAFIVSLLMLALLQWKIGDKLSLVVWGLLIAQFLPLFVVNPTGPRNFYPIYCLLTLMAALRFSSLGLGELRFPKFVLPVVVALLFVPWFFDYSQVAMVEHDRDLSIQEAIRNEEKVVTLPAMPVKLVHGCNPAEGTFQHETYKEVKGLSQDVRIVFES